MTKSVKLCVAAATFLVLALCAHYWVKFHPKSGTQINIPLLLKEASSVDTSFVVERAGSYWIEIWYPKKSSSDVMKDLYSLSGFCVLSSTSGKVLKRVALPTRHIIGGEDSMGTALVRFDAAKNTPYALQIAIDHLPKSFLDVGSTVKIETDLSSYKTLLAVKCLVYLLSATSIVCILLLIVHLRVKQETYD